MPHYFLTYFIHGLAIIFALNIVPVSAAELHVAVAANFTKPLKLLKQQFEQNTPHHLITSFGATGQLYTQIKHGAPFDLFLAADMKRPEQLVKEGIAIADSLSTYAIGKLVLWSPQAGLVDSKGKILKDGQFKHLAIAHPKLAPYGTAAKQVLEKLGLWYTLQHKIVRGNNASQAHQFVLTGNAELGFIALSHYLALEEKSHSSHWLVPEKWYTPIRQGLVLLKKAEKNPAGNAFLAFLQSPSAQQIIKEFGYAIP